MSLLEYLRFLSFVDAGRTCIMGHSFMSVQYVPLLTAGIIPSVGPGGMLTSFTMNHFHIIGVLVMTTPLSTRFYQLAGKIYLGALVNVALVIWMFMSSQVMAPIPV